jgi:hypothetical protein
MRSKGAFLFVPFRMLKMIAVMVCVTGVIGVTGTGCVSTFYGTARIEPGTHLDVGVGAASFISASSDVAYSCVGGRVDVQGSHGFNQYLQIDARLAGSVFFSERYERPDITSWNISPIDPAIGVQAALPLNWFTPAIRTEITSTLFWGVKPVISPVLLFGFGNPEFLTLGARARIGEWKFFDTFAVVHIAKRWSIFTGIDITSIVDDQYPLMGTLSIGYSIK